MRNQEENCIKRLLSRAKESAFNHRIWNLNASALQKRMENINKRNCWSFDFWVNLSWLTRLTLDRWLTFDSHCDSCEFWQCCVYIWLWLTVLSKLPQCGFVNRELRQTFLGMNLGIQKIRGKPILKQGQNIAKSKTDQSELLPMDLS